MRRITRALGLTSLLALTSATVAMAQVADACPVGQIEMGTIGIGELECENCRVGVNIYADSGIGRRLWDFRAEPTVGRIVVGSPAAGRLRGGDVITAIDGYLITTREGGRRYGALVPGKPVTLGVRRDGREMDVTVTPLGECARVEVMRSELAPEPMPPSQVPPVERVPWVPPPTRFIPPPPPVPSPSALGFSIYCTDCSLQRLADPEAWVWSFSEPPVIERVEPGSPAHDAGLDAGDVLTHIDGLSLVDSEAGRRFGAVEPGDRVTFTYLRGTEERTATLVAGATGGRGDAIPPEPAAPGQYEQSDITRFSGSLGDAVIQVTGGRVTVTRTDDEIVIQSSDITVRIRRSGGR